MAQGISIHIGLNHVDPNAYDGWDGQLSGCLNDANAMQQIADRAGFTTSMLTDEQATTANVVAAISNAAGELASGDLLLLTYSGHGGQVPDEDAEEEDSQDETWVLFDRMLIDDQLYSLWQQFQAGVRIFVLSDSCHSGTILRDMIMQQVKGTDAGLRGYKAKSVTAIRDKSIPAAKQIAHYQKNRDYYRMVQHQVRGKGGRKRSADDPVPASVLLISGCQDNQTSSDGDVNGLFTQNLLEVWNNDAFTGSYKKFYQQILAKMPPTQTPNYYKVGAQNDEFESERPFTIEAAAAAETQPQAAAGAPSVQGPSSCSRDDDAPTFTVDKAGAPYYIFEITSDYSLFSNYDGRDDTNFYGSYSDNGGGPSRLTDETFTLPEGVWQSLKAADTLYYRVGTTTSQTGWDNYQTSTSDDDAAAAPSIAIVGAKAPKIAAGPRASRRRRRRGSRSGPTDPARTCRRGGHVSSNT